LCPIKKSFETTVVYWYKINSLKTHLSVRYFSNFFICFYYDWELCSIPPIFLIPLICSFEIATFLLPPVQAKIKDPTISPAILLVKNGPKKRCAILSPWFEGKQMNEEEFWDSNKSRTIHLRWFLRSISSTQHVVCWSRIKDGRLDSCFKSHNITVLLFLVKNQCCALFRYGHILYCSLSGTHKL